MENNKLRIICFLFLLFLLHLSHLLTAQPLLHGEQQGKKKNDWGLAATHADKAFRLTQESSNLMGEEKCEEENEECAKRRMITEPHLDYIYTQTHNKP